MEDNEAAIAVDDEIVDNFSDGPDETPVDLASQPATQPKQAGEEVPPEESASEFAEAGEDGDLPLPPRAVREAPAAPEAVEVKFDPAQLERAGLTAEQAKQHFGSAEALQKALDWQDQQMLALGRKMAEQQPAVPPQQPAPQQPAPQQQQSTVQPQPAPNAPPTVSRKFDLKLDPQRWDEETVSLLSGINEHYGKAVDELAERNTSLEKTITQLLQHQVQQLEAAYYDNFDRQLNELPDTYRSVFGQGTRFDLKPDSEEFRNRVRLDNAITALSRGRAAQGLPPLPAKQLFESALRLEFGNAREAAVRKEVVDKVAKRQKSFIAKPTGRRPKPQTSDERAGAFVAEFLKSRGLTAAEEEADPATL